MTVARRGRKPGRIAGRAVAVSFAASVAVAVPGMARATEQVVVDWRTGLAISGFDPVAYFVDAKPTLGRAGLEANFARAVWRFDNEGNEAVFLADPDIYMPRFGGYDPTALARGVARAGHPLQWLVYGERLYLFYSSEARAAFLADPIDAIAAADRAWPEVARTLAP